MAMAGDYEKEFLLNIIVRTQVKQIFHMIGVKGLMSLSLT